MIEESEFKRLTDYEIRRYVFKPTQNYPIITSLAVTYLDFYKKVGADASAVMKFSAGNSNTVISDKPNKMIISPGAGGADSIIAVLNTMLIDSCKKDIRGALLEKEQDDSRRYKFEKYELKFNKKLNKQERKLAKKTAKRRAKQIAKYGYVIDTEESEPGEETAPEASEKVVTADTVTAVVSESGQEPTETLQAVEGHCTPLYEHDLTADIVSSPSSRAKSGSKNVSEKKIYNEEILQKMFEEKGDNR